MAVGEFVAVEVGVGVRVGVGVFVAVEEGVGVRVGVAVDVAGEVGVDVFVAVEVGVGVRVEVDVGVAVGAGVGVSVGVDVGVLTVTEAVMNGWIAQWYPKVPADVNVKENVPPVDILPEFHTPVSDVDVCWTPPLLVHWTVSPTTMVIDAGVNTKSVIDTGCVESGAVGLRGKARSERLDMRSNTISAPACLAVL